jgi:hypothetical protein
MSRNHYDSGISAFDVIKIAGSGTTINDFSTDTSLTDNSDSKISTQKAIKTYVDTQIVSAGNHSQIYYVGKSGHDTNNTGIHPLSPFLTIEKAITAINLLTPNETNRYTIIVHPGKYEENNPLTLSEYVTIEAFGEPHSTLIYSANDGASKPLFTVSDHSSINGFSLRAKSGANNNACIYLASENSTFRINNCIIDNLNDGTYDGIGIHVNNATECHIHASNLYFRGFCEHGFFAENGGIYVQGLFIDHAFTATNMFYMENAGHMSIHSVDLKSSNVVNGVQINDGTSYVNIIGGRFEGLTTAFLLTNTCASTTLIGIRSLGIKNLTGNILEALTSGVSGTFSAHASNVDRSKISLHATNSIQFYTEGFDTHLKKFRHMADLSIGKDGTGNSLQVGEGGSYTYNTVCKSYNGSVYADETGSTIDFPNTTAGTIIYFCDKNSYDVYGLHYNVTTAIVLGAGAIIWEYWDSASWSTINIMETQRSLSASNNNSSFGSTGLHTLRFNIHISDDMSVTTVDSIVGMWVRCRIVTGITTSPIITGGDVDATNRFAFCGSYAEIRSDGTRSYHGIARPLKSIECQFQRSNSGDQTLNISTSITAFPMADNVLSGVQKDTMGVIFRIIDEVDTSCSVKVGIIGYGSAAGATSENIRLDLSVSSVNSTSLFNGSNSEENQAMDISFDPYTQYTIVNAESQIFDISACVPGDIVFIQIERDGGAGSDTYGGNFILSSIHVHYHAWQDGGRH